ncbi:MAG: hypothetical protein KC502_21125 [Myxococcales bacterium]|nr:hypothetical protein [Myxococcales bacterium]
MSLHRTLDFVFRQPADAAPIHDLRGWWRRHRDVAQRFSDPGSLAIVAGFLADRVGYAFASGYQCALHAVWPEIEPTRVVSLCVTEQTGNGPRQMHTRLELVGDQVTVKGEKTFATLANFADDLLVVGKMGEFSGRPKLGVVRLEPGDPGVSMEVMDELLFAPEVSHVHLTLDTQVSAQRLSADDGWNGLVKPFGALEDALVRAAVCGHLIGVARARGWQDDLVDTLSAVALALATFDGQTDLRSHAVWRTLEATLKAADRIIAEADELLSAEAEADESDEVAHRWLRDRMLLDVGKGRRTARLARARKS